MFEQKLCKNSFTELVSFYMALASIHEKGGGGIELDNLNVLYARKYKRIFAKERYCKPTRHIKISLFSPLPQKNFCFVSKPGSKNGLHASDYSFYTSIRRHSEGIKNSYHAK